jgi:hypothetical protein
LVISTNASEQRQVVDFARCLSEVNVAAISLQRCFLPGSNHHGLLHFTDLQLRIKSLDLVSFDPEIFLQHGFE